MKNSVSLSPTNNWMFNHRYTHTTHNTPGVIPSVQASTLPPSGGSVCLPMIPVSHAVSSPVHASKNAAAGCSFSEEDLRDFCPIAKYTPGLPLTLF